MNHWIHIQPSSRSDYQLLTRSLKYMTTNSIGAGRGAVNREQDTSLCSGMSVNKVPVADPLL